MRSIIDEMRVHQVRIFLSNGAEIEARIGENELDRLNSIVTLSPETRPVFTVIDDVDAFIALRAPEIMMITSSRRTVELEPEGSRYQRTDNAFYLSNGAVIVLGNLLADQITQEGVNDAQPLEDMFRILGEGNWYDDLFDLSTLENRIIVHPRHVYALIINRDLVNRCVFFNDDDDDKDEDGMGPEDQQIGGSPD